MSDPRPSTSGLTSLELSKLPRGAISMSGSPVARNARLPSIKGPRDLTLGAGAKRVFTPNIPVRRDKKVAQDAATSSARSNKGTRGRGSRNRGRGKNAFVQTPGTVFGEGVGMLPKNAMSRSYDYTSTSATIQMPTIKRDVKVKVEPYEDPELSDDFIDDPEEKIDSKLTPVTVPIQPLGNRVNDSKEDNDLDGEGSSSTAKVKKEKLDEEMLPETFGQLLNLCNIEERDDLLLMELTDYIDSIFRIDEDDDLSDNSENQDRVSDTKNKSLLDLSSFDSGHIGKLQILADGSTRLLVGNHVFNGFLEQPSPFLQEVVTVQQSEEATHLNVIGRVKHVAKFLTSVDDVKLNDIPLIS